MSLGIYKTGELIEITLYKNGGLESKLVIYPLKSPSEYSIENSVGFCRIKLNRITNEDNYEATIVNKKIALCFHELLNIDEKLNWCKKF